MFFNNKNIPYIAIIGDIIDSKEISDRKVIQERLNDILDKINMEYKDNISSKFMITLGDEFQGLLHNGCNVIRIIEFIEYSMYPVKIRFGIGVGSITTAINYDFPLGADGPAYYNAREMIEDLKVLKNKTEEYNIKIKTDDEVDVLLNTIFSLLFVIKNKWSDKQRNYVFHWYYYDLIQIELASIFNVTQGAVQQSLKKANYKKYKNALDVVENVLSKIRSN